MPGSGIQPVGSKPQRGSGSLLKNWPNFSYGVSLTSNRASQSQSLESYLREKEQALLARAKRYRRGADLARAGGNTAGAVLNYRRAVNTGASGEDAEAARTALVSYLQDAAAKLQEAERLSAAQEFDKAAALLRQLWRDYSELPVAEQIQQLRGRLQRLSRSTAPVPQLEARPALEASAGAGASRGQATALAGSGDQRDGSSKRRDSLSAVQRLSERSDQPTSQ